MNFGDWELFRIVLLALRDKEYLINNENNSNINFKHTRSGSSKNHSHERRGIEIFSSVKMYKIIICNTFLEITLFYYTLID